MVLILGLLVKHRFKPSTQIKEILNKFLFY